MPVIPPPPFQVSQTLGDESLRREPRDLSHPRGRNPTIGGVQRRSWRPDRSRTPKPLAKAVAFAAEPVPTAGGHGLVDDRTTRRGSSGITRSVPGMPSMAASNILAASAPMCDSGIATVVNGGRQCASISSSSLTTTEMSSGTWSPAASKALRAPNAESMLEM